MDPCPTHIHPPHPPIDKTDPPIATTDTPRHRPRGLTADAHQRTVLRAELHDHIDQIINNLPTIERISKEMGRGFTSSTITDGRGSNDDLTTTERLATQPQPDPATWALQALHHWDNTLNDIRRAARRFRGLMPLTEAELTDLEERQRQAAIPTCGLCQLPIPDKAHRIDDVAYHANTCYFKVWRAQRDAQRETG